MKNNLYIPVNKNSVIVSKYYLIIFLHKSSLNRRQHGTG
jgi:hypothetical protein